MYLALTQNQPETELLTAVAAGDRKATVALVKRFERPVFALLSRMLGTADPHRLEDIAQEVFLKVFRALPNFDPKGKAQLSTWVLTIATRVAIDELRRRPADVPTGELPEPTVVPQVEQVIDRARLGQAIEQAALSLPEGQRAAFVLRVYHELGYPEIAEALGVDVGTVKSRISRARAALKRALRHTGWEDL
ncbi:MAG: RNA polymerase sigma factor [Bradymonadia bacterium]